MIPTGPLSNTHWTVLGPGSPQNGRPTSEVLCICGTVRTLLNRLLVGAEARSRSCGCRRGEAVRDSRALDPESAMDPRPTPPNGFAVALTGSVRGEKWAAGAPELPDPWYVGPREAECAIRFRDRREAREWIGRRKVSVRSPGEYRVVPLAFAESAPWWLPVPLLSALRHSAQPAVHNCAVIPLDGVRS